MMMRMRVKIRTGVKSSHKVKDPSRKPFLLNDLVSPCILLQLPFINFDFSSNPEVFRFLVPYNQILRITVHDAQGDGMGHLTGPHLGTWSWSHGATVLASGGGHFGFEQTGAVIIPGPTGLAIISVTGEGTSGELTSFNITFASNQGWTYAVDRSRDLGTWEALSTTITGEEGATIFADNDPILDGKGVFYRVREVSD